MSYPGYPPYQQAPGGNQPMYPMHQPGYAPAPGPGGYGLPPPPGGAYGYPPSGVAGYPPTPIGGAAYPPAVSSGSIHVQHQTAPACKYAPTVRPAQPFNPQADAQTLRKAMKGFGTDEKAIINVLARRTMAQRMEIGVQFKMLFQKNLVDNLKSETSGRFKDVLVAMMTPLPQCYAKVMHDAILGMGTDEDALIEVLCTMNNNEIRAIRATYQTMFSKSLDEDLEGDTSGTFKGLVISLCNAGRDETLHTDKAAAIVDAKALYRAGEKRMGTDESTFNAIMCQRNYAQLALIFDEYHVVAGHEIEKAIKKEFSGNSKKLLLALTLFVRNRPCFFANKLHESMAGLGTKDRLLIRLVVTRCEIDMAEIKTCYQAKFQKPLKSAITGDTSGDYKKILLALIGE